MTDEKRGGTATALGGDGKGVASCYRPNAGVNSILQGVGPVEW